MQCCTIKSAVSLKKHGQLSSFMLNKENITVILHAVKPNSQIN